MDGYLGIDACALHLECMVVNVEGEVLRKSRFSNTQDGFARLWTWKGEDVVCTGIEATGIYHKDLCRYLGEGGHPVTVLNPYRARSLAIGLGVLAKSDQTDALVLANMMRLLRPKPTCLRSELHDRLRAISRLIQSHTEDRTEAKKRLKGTLGREAKDAISRHIAFLTSEILVLEKSWLELVGQSQALNENYKLALSVPYIGPKTARVVVSELPEDLVGFTPKQIAAYVGVVPQTNSSGKCVKHASIGHTGNAHIRKASFMPAVLGCFKDAELSAFYNKLIAKGRHHLQATVAVMHKCMLRIGAVLTRRSPWVAQKT